MSIVKKLGEGYRFTERDFKLGWELLVKSDTTDEQNEFVHFSLLAEKTNTGSGTSNATHRARKNPKLIGRRCWKNRQRTNAMRKSRTKSEAMKFISVSRDGRT